MVDRIATLDETIARLVKSAGRATSARACAPCGGTGRTVAMENGVPKILNEDCPGCAGTGEALVAADIPEDPDAVEPVNLAAQKDPPVPPQGPADDPRSSAVSLAAQRENDRARLRLLELS